MKALSVLDVAAHRYVGVLRRVGERYGWVVYVVSLSYLQISMAGVRVSLVAGSAAAGRAARVVLFVLVVVDALQVFVI